jgi:hypothetical protein
VARGGGKRRTYARDNRGRFASTGATARGGRLKTAAGNKRKTVTARMAPAKAAGTIGKRKGLKARPAQLPKPSAEAKPAQPASALKRVKTRAQKADQAARLASRAASRSQSPALSKEASLRNERRSVRLKERSKQLSKEPKLSRRQKDIAARARRDYGVKSTASKPRVSARGKVKNTNSEQQAPKAAGKMKPLKGVGSVVARNLQGFKGMPVQIRSRKEASKAYRQRTNQTGKTAAGRRLDSDLRRVVTARSTVQQRSVFGGVKRVSSGPMRPIGERASDGSIRRSRRSKPAPIVGSKSWRKGAERMMKTGQIDPWVQAQYNRLYGKR